MAGAPIDQKWRDRGHDQHSVIADPLFEDAGKGNFRLKPGSPTSQIEFKPIDTTGVGANVVQKVATVAPAFPVVE